MQAGLTLSHLTTTERKEKSGEEAQQHTMQHVATSAMSHFAAHGPRSVATASGPRRYMDVINNAISLQPMALDLWQQPVELDAELVQLYNEHQSATSASRSTRTTLVSAIQQDKRPRQLEAHAPTLMHPRHLAALSARAAVLVAKKAAHTGMPRTAALSAMRKLVLDACTEALTKADELSMADLERVLRGLAVAKVEPPEELRMQIMWKLRPEGDNKIRSVTSAGMARVLDSLTNLGWMDPGLLMVIESRVKRRAREAEPGDLSLIASGLKEAGCRDAQVYSAITVAAMHHMHLFTAQQMVQLLDALSGSPAPLDLSLLSAAAEVIITQLDYFAKSEVVSLVKIYARVEYHHQMLMEGLARMSVKCASLS
eukprot:gene15840-21965_t